MKPLDFPLFADENIHPEVVLGHILPAFAQVRPR